MSNESPLLGRVLFFHALTPLHAGTGEGVGEINLPTAREVATGLPFLPGSSIKGVLRSLAEDNETSDAKKNVEDPVWRAFGPDTEQASAGRGGLVVGDAHLLALPVRSLVGMFAWVASPYMLLRLTRDVELARGAQSAIAAVPPVPKMAGGINCVTQNTPSVLWAKRNPEQKGAQTAAVQGRIFLEEMLLDAESNPRMDKWAEWIAKAVWPNDETSRKFFVERFVLVSDTTMRHLAETALEVRARVKIDGDSGTAAASGSWTEEHLPTETLLYGAIWARRSELSRTPEELGAADAEEEERSNNRIVSPAKKNLQVLQKSLKGGDVLRFGGKSSIGLGRARVEMSQ